jgi:hypothetical protein
MVWVTLEEYGVENLQVIGGFGGNIGHDPHLLYTLSAVQILLELDALEQVDLTKIANCMKIIHLNFKNNQTNSQVIF